MSACLHQHKQVILFVCLFYLADNFQSAMLLSFSMAYIFYIMVYVIYFYVQIQQERQLIIYIFLNSNFQKMKALKGEHKDRKMHDDYLMHSNYILVSEQNQPLPKKSHSRKLSLLSNPAPRDRDHIFASKVKSVYKSSQKQQRSTKRSSKNKSKITDSETVKTGKTFQTVNKKPVSVLFSPSKFKSGHTSKRIKPKEKITLDSIRNKQPIKLSKSGKFYHDSHEAAQTVVNRIESYTHHTCHQNSDEELEQGGYSENRQQLTCQRMNSVDCLSSLQQVYKQCTSILSGYQKKVNQLNKQNSKLKQENKKLKQSHRHK